MKRYDSITAVKSVSYLMVFLSHWKRNDETLSADCDSHFWNAPAGLFAISAALVSNREDGGTVGERLAVQLNCNTI